jgi:hypothetical protein
MQQVQSIIGKRGKRRKNRLSARLILGHMVNNHMTVRTRMSAAGGLSDFSECNNNA